MDKDELKLITKICYLYYYEEEVQSKIAKRFNLTRQMVSRLIQKAKDEGILKIIIASPVQEVIGLEADLESKYGLKEAIVVQSDTLDDIELVKKVGKASGEYLSKVLMNKLNVGIGFGLAIQSMAEYIHGQSIDYDFKDVNYVQLTGGINSSSSFDNSQYIMNLLAQKTMSHVSCMNIPSIIDDEKMRDTISESMHYQKFMDAYNNLHYAFVQINPADRIYYSADKSINESGKTYLNRLGISYLNGIDAVGEVCLNYFNDRGHFVETPINDQIMGITSKKLKSVKNLVGIAAGKASHDAALGAIRAKAFDILIIDEDTARYLLDN
ncbi:sugar-binding transcriptional regulator [Acidaminobacter sp. JC074]|uniref:sugar-binding transcriptional regulator n=1 Tax=Acidaminobacter sp. JC074 TaxID=2530199 RepID=UPI001F0D4711|nr:sugar-binding domain-containing protein [Acidaminobacter sp. JC074]